MVAVVIAGLSVMTTEVEVDVPRRAMAVGSFMALVLMVVMRREEK
jgi:hypothetical protein